MAYSPGKKRSLEELACFQGSPPPSSGMVLPDKHETKQRWQKDSMDEQGAPD